MTGAWPWRVDGGSTIVQAEAALALDERAADAHSNICFASVHLGDYDRAAGECLAALAIEPHHRLAAANLRWALARKAQAEP